MLEIVSKEKLHQLPCCFPDSWWQEHGKAIGTAMNVAQQNQPRRLTYPLSVFNRRQIRGDRH
jgi:hypothetical protein